MRESGVLVKVRLWLFVVAWILGSIVGVTSCESISMGIDFCHIGQNIFHPERIEREI